MPTGNGCVFPFSIHRGHAAGPNIESILHPVFVPLVLLSKRNFQLLPFLIPLGHESAAPILGYQLAFAHPLRLVLKLIVLAESTNIGIHARRQAGPTELTQSDDTVGGKMMQLYLKSFKDMVEKPCRREVKTASKDVTEHDDVSSLRPRHCFTLRRLRLPLAKTALLL